MELVSFKKLFEQIKKKDRFIFDNFKEVYSKHSKNSEYESLFDHVILVEKYFLNILNINALEKVYDSLIISILDLLSLDDSLKEYYFYRIKYSIVESLLYHDFGKLNPNFQESVIDNSAGKNTKHSIFSYFLLLLKNRSYFEKDKTLFFFMWLFYYIVKFHHTSLESFNINDFFKKKILENVGDIEEEILFEILEKYNLFKFFNIKKDDFDVSSLFFMSKVNSLKNNLLGAFFNSNSDRFKDYKGELFFLIKLFYSHLVLSDFFASAEYSFGKELSINVIDESFFKNIKDSFFKTKEYNRNLTNWNLKEVSSCNNINELRMNLLKKASDTLKKSLLENKNNKIFMLNVPTGGGKTNISLKLVLDILEYDKTIKRIFWVFPFINIIEQNYEVISDTFNVKSDIFKVYSTNIFFSENKIDSDYSENKSNFNFEEFIYYKFLNNKINVISNINFFNTFIKTKKNNRYRPLFYSNSIVVLDEIQSLPIEELDFFYNLLEYLSEKYNIYFIVMSATLPDLNLYTSRKTIHLIENYEEYFSSKIFQRNKFICRFKHGDDNLDSFEKIKDRLLFLKEEKNKILIVFNTINSSIKFFNSIKEEISDIPIFLLNSTINSYYKKKIIKKIKTLEKAILVSTQSIEAGVDLDFDIALRDYAPIDSIEQVAGRVNRESKKNKENSFIEIFKLKNNNRWEFEYVYKSRISRLDYSPKIFIQLKQYLYKKHNIFESFDTILEKKDFFKYYEELKEFVENIKEGGFVTNYTFGLKESDFKKISSLNVFETVPSFKFFIPFFIKAYFNKDFLEYLKKFDLVIEEKKGDLIYVQPDISSIKKHILDLKKNFFSSESYIFSLNSFLSLFEFSVPMFNRSPENVKEILYEKGIIDENNVLMEEYKDKFLKFYSVDNEKYFYIDLSYFKEILKGNGDEGLIL